MRSWFRLTLVVGALIAGVVITVLVAGGGDEAESSKGAAKAAGAKPLPPIQGPQMNVDGLVYNVTDVRVLDFDSPSAAPYLTNLQRPGKGTAYLGVFMRVYNPSGRAVASAPGYLLEPAKAPELAEMVKASESPYSLILGGKVQANGVLPEPGTAAASGQFPGAMLLYGINTKTTAAQPFDLVVHTSKGTIAKLRLPPIPKLTGKLSHG